MSNPFKIVDMSSEKYKKLVADNQIAKEDVLKFSIFDYRRILTKYENNK